MVGTLILALTSVFEALTPFFIKLIIDEITRKGSTPSWESIGLFIFLLALCLCFLAIARFSWIHHLARFTSSVRLQLQQKAFHRLTRVSLYFFHKNKIGHIINTLTNDIEYFCAAIGRGNLFALDVCFMTMAMLPMMIYISPQWTWKCLFWVPFACFANYLIARKVGKRFKQEQKHLSRVSSHVTETLSGIRVLKSLAKEDFRTASFQKENKNYEKACNRTLGIDAFLDVFSHFSASLGTLVLLWVGSKDVISGTATLGSLVAFQRYIHRMEWPVIAISYALTLYQRGRISFTRVSSILHEKADPAYKGKTKISEFQSLEARNLSFTYPDSSQPTLRNVSFSLKAGEKLALIGNNGSGKSTLLHLLSRLWMGQKESLFINDIPIEKIETKSLYKALTLIGQGPFLFNDSIFNNIALAGSNLTSAKAQELMKNTLLEEDVQKFPQKLETLVGEDGLHLSSGQKQRVALARAIHGGRPLFLCDAPLSHVDYSTAHLIYENLLLKKKRSLIFVLNSPIQIPYFDKVLVFKEGEVEFFGDLQKAREQSSTYNHFCKGLESLTAFTKNGGKTCQTL